MKCQRTRYENTTPQQARPDNNKNKNTIKQEYVMSYNIPGTVSNKTNDVLVRRSVRLLLIDGKRTYSGRTGITGGHS